MIAQLRVGDGARQVKVRQPAVCPQQRLQEAAPTTHGVWGLLPPRGRYRLAAMLDVPRLLPAQPKVQRRLVVVSERGFAWMGFPRGAA